MPLADMADVAARMGRPLSSEEAPRVSALLADVTGLIEDHCGRDLVRREAEQLVLLGDGTATLTVPRRYRTAVSVKAVQHEGQEVTGWTIAGGSLIRPAGWPMGPLALTASWGLSPVPPALIAVACAEVIRWMAVSPGVEREQVGEVAVTFAGAGATHSLSSAARAALRRYRRPGIGTIPLTRM